MDIRNWFGGKKLAAEEGKKPAVKTESDAKPPIKSKAPKRKLEGPENGHKSKEKKTPNQSAKKRKVAEKPSIETPSCSKENTSSLSEPFHRDAEQIGSKDEIPSEISPEERHEESSDKKETIQDTTPMKQEKNSNPISEVPFKKLPEITKWPAPICTKPDKISPKKELISELPPMMWVDKYKPKSSGDLIGNADCVFKLKNWLQNWKRNPKRAVLLSGGPGIGKSSAAILVALECGFEAVEFNASDVRGKKAIQENISEMIGNRTLGEFFVSGKKAPKKVCLIMDEIDGMSSGDRGGIAEIIILIKKTKIPVICICNDRSSPKITSLAKHCLDIRFNRPALDRAEMAIVNISAREGLIADRSCIRNILESVNVDIRQAINLLQMYKSTSDHLARDKKLASKDITYGTYDAFPRIFNRSIPLSDRISLYESDRSMLPLRFHENYLATAQNSEIAAAAAESISDGDLFDACIFKNQFFELDNACAILSTVRPAFLIGQCPTNIGFPSWLGKNSSTTKRYRLLKDIRNHMSPTTFTDSMEVRLQYLPVLKDNLVNPLINLGLDGVDEVIKLMDIYEINREDWEAILEIIQIGKGEDIMKNIPTNVKTTFTKRYNSLHHAIRGAPSKMTSLKDDIDNNSREDNNNSRDEDNNSRDEDNNSRDEDNNSRDNNVLSGDEEDDENINSDKLIRIGKPKKIGEQKQKDKPKNTRKPKVKKM